VSAQHVNHPHVFSAQPADSVENRQVGLTRPILFQTLSTGYSNVRNDAASECVDEGCFADTGFPRYKNDVTLTCPGLLDPPSQPGQCFVPANESLSRNSDSRD
jgi:hypothetical protein